MVGMKQSYRHLPFTFVIPDMDQSYNLLHEHLWYYINGYHYLLEHLRYHGGYETELPSLTVTFVIPDMEQEHLLFYI